MLFAETTSFSLPLNPALSWLISEITFDPSAISNDRPTGAEGPIPQPQKPPVFWGSAHHCCDAIFLLAF
jgi:hypothetical protein